MLGLGVNIDVSKKSVTPSPPPVEVQRASEDNTIRVSEDGTNRISE